MTQALRARWFYLILPLALFAAWSLSTMPEAVARPLTLERVLLFDFALFIPALYFLFLRGRVSRQAALLRTLALAGTGVWVVAWLMPAGEGVIVPWLGWVRYVALPLLIGVELVAMIAVLRHVFGDTPSQDHLIASGMPPLLAKAMLAEARFWKRVFAWLRGQ